MSAEPREHLSADQWREIAYAKHYGRTGYEAHDMYDAINLLLGEIALLRDERDAATRANERNDMTTSPREPTTAEIEAALSRIREFAAARSRQRWDHASGGVFPHDSVRLVWPIAYAAGRRDQEAEDFAELNHMSTQCDRANEVVANAEERHERVVKALSGLLDALQMYDDLAELRAHLEEAEAALADIKGEG